MENEAICPNIQKATLLAQSQWQRPKNRVLRELVLSFPLLESRPSSLQRYRYRLQTHEMSVAADVQHASS
jgi:hypothetical protein